MRPGGRFQNFFEPERKLVWPIFVDTERLASTTRSHEGVRMSSITVLKDHSLISTG